MSEYNIEDFTEDNYRRLLRIAKEHNVVTTYEKALMSTGIVLRHDIDLSPNRALALAQIEADEGVSAYYFVHLHSEFYNPFEKKIVNILKDISKQGGVIGLHFEPCFYDIGEGDVDSLEKYVEIEKNILMDMLDISEITHMSFHNPDVGNWHLLPNDTLDGMVNVYGSKIKSSFEYCSDSNGYWRFKRLEDVLRNSDGKRLHILTHPCWWQHEVMLPYDRVERCAKGRMDSCTREYTLELKALGRENVGVKA